jgi:hypothetical protein
LPKTKKIGKNVQTMLNKLTELRKKRLQLRSYFQMKKSVPKDYFMISKGLNKRIRQGGLFPA